MWKRLLITSVTKVHVLDKQQSIKFLRFGQQILEIYRKHVNFSAAAVYNQIYSKLSTNQKQSYICKSAIYAHWNGLSKLSTNQKQSFICKSAIVLRRRDTKDT